MVDRVDGANVAQVAAKVETHAVITEADLAAAKPEPPKEVYLK